MFLFGIYIDSLYKALAMVESDRGATSANVYQISKIYVDDVNRLCPSMKFSYRDVYDREKSELMMFLYWKHYAYAYTKESSKPVTAEVLAKMHNRGGRYWKQDVSIQRKADRYWQKVKRELSK